jgi:hypothetical protein
MDYTDYTDSLDYMGYKDINDMVVYTLRGSHFVNNYLVENLLGKIYMVIFIL